MSSMFLHLGKDSFKFAAGHMTVFPDGTKERLHGHNFQVSVTVEVASDTFIAFEQLKQAIRAACAAWDEQVLLARRSPHMQILPSADHEIDFVLCGDRYVLPRGDVVWLDMDNVTTEGLAAQFCRIAAAALQPLWAEGRLLSLAVQIDESAGQGASFRLDAADVLSLDAAPDIT